jgi:magnesium-transporting ATPase (P-type)
MNKNLLVLLGVIVVVGLISALLTYLRAGKMSPTADIAAKGLAAVQKGNLIFFGVLVPLVVGIIAFFVYRGMLARSPDTAQNTFLFLAIGIGIVLSILAAVVFKMRGFVELTLLHIVYIAGFGWIIPMLWAR